MNFVRAFNFRRAVVALAALALGTAGQAKAEIILDNYSEPVPQVTTILPDGDILTASVATLLTSASTDFPSMRTINYTLIPTGPSPTLISNVGGATGALTVDLGFSGAAQIVVSYAFNSTANLTPSGVAGNLLLTGASQTALNGDPTTYNLSIATATGVLTGSGVLSGLAPIALSGLGGSGDLTQVTSLTLTINAGAAADLVINSLSATTPPPTSDVPAPPAVFLALAALPVLGLRRKLMKKA